MLLKVFFPHEIYFPCKQDGNAFVDARSSVGDSDSENDACFQRSTAVGETTTQSSSIQGDDMQAPRRRAVKSNKEESNRQSTVSFTKSSALTLADNRSSSRHSAIFSGGKSLHRFHPNRLFRKDVSSSSNISSAATGSSMNNAVLRSRSKLLSCRDSGILWALWAV